MKTKSEKLKDYETILKVLRRHFAEQALIGEEIDLLRDICAECYEATVHAREMLKEIDKILKG